MQNICFIYFIFIISHIINVIYDIIISHIHVIYDT